MKKKWMAALLCAFLLVQLVGIPTQAVGNVYFIGAEENILPLSDDTMPFWHENYLYIPSSIFTGITRNSLKVGYSAAGDGSWVALYQGDDALLFHEETGYCENADGLRLYPGAVRHNGQLYVPASIVAAYFGLRYSVTKVSHGWLVWLRTRDFVLTDSQFADAAHSVMEQRYGDYVAAQAGTPEPEILPPSIPQESIVSGKKIYLCVQAGQNTVQLLDTLSRYGAQMTVFCTPEYLEENDDLLRRMTGTGHSVGILADGTREDLPVLEQLQAGNEALRQATGEKTRLVRVENADEETLQAVSDAGYCPAVSNLELPRYTLGNGYQANLLFRSVSTSGENSVLWLGDAMQASGLVTFLIQVVEAKEYCLALTEVVDVA